MLEPDTEVISQALDEPESSSPALQEAARELQAAEHDAQVAFDCIALGEPDRAHTHALTARVAIDAAVTALAAALTQETSAGETSAGETSAGEASAQED
jgi:hypothetical protein